MARAGKAWDDECCAVHDGTIGSFSSLSLRLSNIGEWRRVTEREGVNIAKVGKITGGAVAVGLVATGAGAIAAPAIGGAIGGLAGLSGAAATSHGLAVLGGGALAAGGFGMAGGSTVIAVGATLLGGAGGGVLVNKFAGEIEGFDIRTRRQGSRTQVMVVNGFLSQDEDLLGSWERVLKGNFSKNVWYEVAWESKRLRDLGALTLSRARGTALHRAAVQMAKVATKNAGKKLSPAVWLSTLLEIGGNPWLVALSKAQKTGQILADLILRADGRARYVLMGHSLGARVVYYTLQALAESGKPPRIEEVHLLGGAVGNSRATWRGISTAVRGKIYNYYSENDGVLRVLYRIGTLFSSEPIGRAEIKLRSDRIQNVNVSSLVMGHGDFKSNFSNFIYGQHV